MNIEQSEQLKYEQLWKNGSYRSKSAIPFAYWLMAETLLEGRILEIGCGDGATMKELANHGIVIRGCDITLEGCPGPGPVDECPAWDLPYSDGEFDCTFSTDVLEHIPPEKIMATVKEILRVTRKISIHQIATFAMGEEHLMVKPITWWNHIFYTKGIRTLIIERAN